MEKIKMTHFNLLFFIERVLLIAVANFLNGRLIFAFLLTHSSTGQALTFHENTTTGVIHAIGIVELDDAERLSQILTVEYKQKYHNVRGRTTITFDSPGGSLLGGLRLGYALRKLSTHTEISEGDSCMSACAIAFLGGDARTVAGQYGVHAARVKEGKTTVSLNDQLDTVQKLSAVLMAYSREMTGANDIALRALETSSSSISILTDAELVSLRVITLARRPTQFGTAGFKCPSKIEFTVIGTICSHIDISDLDLELNNLFRKIQEEKHSDSLQREQVQWRRYRNSCVNDGVPNGYSSVVQCVRESYMIRRDQLLSIWLSLSAKKTGPGISNWAEIPPH